ncbi:putative disease resistance protein At3g14460 [Ziziphus jujuba]|uniref:Disease resistance protein At3g14460 n=1 Tax=Ziziphus jujuba TaxID=326968 RepID=A0A6P6G538_ZIZJJ|nr:putative disease resistance protein At3g14460 [Ziziphus jujuba]
MAGEMVGGAFLSASLQVLFDRMTSLELVDFIRGKKLNIGLFKKLKIKLLSANSVLNDAEEKQISNSAVREWLNELHEAICDAEDLVDEINTEALRCKMEAEYGSSSSHQVLNLFSSSTTTSFNKQVEYKMVDILDRLEFILDQKDALGLKEGVQTRPSRRLPATSSVEESGVYGRNDDKEAVIKLLLIDNGSGDNMSVIPIVGMGGIGKTTLAQLVYNDERVKKCFDFKAWVSVSAEFDVFKIIKTITERVTSQTFFGHDLDLLQIKLEKALRERKFLLILDDVWNEDYFLWEEVKKPFQYGACGSKVIVTTRNESVASVMRNNVPSYQLPIVSNENCWKLFVKHAFNNVDPCAHPKLEEIGKQIVIKCKGLPLAVKSLGSLLRYQLNQQEWEKILESEMWELPEEKNYILPALWLSYQYLPSHVKRCFAFCSIFPKNYPINKEDLIKLWMAEGLLNCQKRKRMEEVGEKCFQYLLTRSLFQQSINWDRSICYIMHDLVNDLATFAAGEFFLSLDDIDSINLPSKIRHLSQVKEKRYDLKKYEVLIGAKYLRTCFLPSRCHDYTQLQSVAAKLLPTLTGLRVLSLRGCFIVELPDLIGKLKLLRYLDLSETDIVEVPNTICTLYNLQTLILSDCIQLKLLPSVIGRLINLRHLDISSTHLERMPLEMGKLKDLQTLTDFVVGKYSGYTIKLLGDLPHLRGKLCFSGLQNIVNVEDVLEAKLKDKKHLTELEFSWGFEEFVYYEKQMEVLDGLEPHTNLKSLKIKFYRGGQFSKWVGDDSFCNLEEIHLERCRECSMLPPLGKLPFLKQLRIMNFDGLVKIGDEFYGSGSSMTMPFQRLEFLLFSSMPVWEDWSFVSGDGVSFPQLKELVLEDCPKLTGGLCLPDTIEDVQITGCEKLEFSVQHCYGSLRRLLIQHSCYFMKSIALDYLPMLEVLSLRFCINLESLTFAEQLCPVVLSLTALHLRICPKFVAFPQGLHAPNMKVFEIEDCKNLRSLPEQMHILLPSLQSLSLTDCPELESFPECGLPSNLNMLRIYNCNKLFASRLQWNLQRLTSLTVLHIASIDEVVESFPEEGLLPTSLIHLNIQLVHHLRSLNGMAFQHLASLESLLISGCNELQLLPEEGLPPSLSDLSISKCALLKQRCQRDTGQDWHKISHIACIRIDNKHI